MAGVPGSQPADLINPVAGAQQASSAGAALAAAKPIPMQAPPAQQSVQKPSLDDIFSGSQGQPAAEQQKPSLDDIFSSQESPEPSSVMQRMKAGFAANDTEKEGYLKQQYGKDNVKKDADGNFKVKEDGKWHPFNNEYSVPGYLTSGGMSSTPTVKFDPANMGRQAMVEAGAAPMEIAGGLAAAGEAATGVGAPAAGPTMAASRMAGGAMGEALARHTAYNIIGIPKSGDYATDAAAMTQMGGLRAIFGAFGDKLASYMQGAGGPEVGQQLATDAHEAIDGMGKGLEQQAHQASLQAAQNASAGDSLTAAKIHLDDVLKLSQQAKDAGIDLYPHELAPFDPKLQKIASAAMANKSLQNSMVVRGEGVNQASKDFLDLFPNASTSNVEQLMSKSLDEGTVVGRSIGDARKLLEQNVEKVQASALQKALPELQEMFGFKPPEGQQYGTTKLSVPPDRATMQELADKFQRPVGDINYVVGRLSKLTDLVENGNGQVSPKDLNSFYSEFTKAIDGRIPAPGTRSATYTGLIKAKDAIRDDVSAAIGTELENSGGKLYQSIDQVQRQAYLDNLATYSKYAAAKANLNKLFEKDTTATADVVRWLKQGGIGNADRVNDFKDMMSIAGPGAWDRVAKEYVGQMLSDHAAPGAEAQVYGNVNWNAMLKQMQPGTVHGEHFRNIVGDDVAQKMFDSASAFAAIQRTAKPFEAQPNLVYRALKSVANIKDPEYAAAVFKSDYYAKKMMESDAAQKIIKNLSEQDQKVLNQAITEAQRGIAMRSYSPKSGVASQIVNQQLQQRQQQQPQQ